ncbi:putative interleukin-17 receptor E-like [Oryzias melastigma]|uniref:Putative interleukin-17 receptor E-like n=1 Tax=Oryzias melastigma TaxID=30732 RepID=A0A834C3H3_ORYME|nr:putative interleukin-17 receptor E-like [Oryzias melastigma]
MMILWTSLLTVFCWCFTEAENTKLDRIERCQTTCSQGLSCRTKGEYWFPPACLEPTTDHQNTSVFQNISVSPVMKCEGKQKCKLNLRVKAVLELSEFIHGLSICTISAGMMRNCQKISFTKTSRTKMSGLQVTVDNDCTEVSPSQQVHITVKTIPEYCGIMWASNYHTPGCIMEDLRRNVPECITGRLSYITNPEMKELRINVSDMLENHTYHLRLCHKDYICVGTGASTQIKKEQPVKSAVLRYSQPLPCLCIEGWSAVVDAPRVQVCPFKDRLEELWSGITFDPLEEALLWEPACPVTAEAGLCEKREDGTCADLPHSSQIVSRGKLKFAKVDPRPQLCMKFTAGSQSWVRCPFGDGFKAWDVVVTSRQGHQDVQLVSQVPATFSVGLCGRSANATCQEDARNVVRVLNATNLTLTGSACSSCLQVKRQDVNYAATVVHCFEQCSQESQDWTWIVLPAAVCLSGIIIVNLVLHLLLTVYQRRKRERKLKQTDSTLDSVASTTQTQHVLRGSLFLTDSPQCRSNEKVNLISK